MKTILQRHKWLLVLALAILAVASIPAFALALGDGPGLPGEPPRGDKPVDGVATPASPSATPVPGTVKELAPIEGIEIAVRESFPPPVSARITYGLPSGCAKSGGYEVAREGDRIAIKVWILRPADPNTACTMIYGIGNHDVPLGSDFAPGTVYTVDVNGTTKTFAVR